MLPHQLPPPPLALTVEATAVPPAATAAPLVATAAPLVATAVPLVATAVPLAPTDPLVLMGQVDRPAQVEALAPVTKGAVG